MEHRYLPAWGPNVLTKWGKMLGVKWVDEFPFDSPHALISYIYWRGAWDFPKESYLFGDSGGFTLISGHLPIDPIDVLRWQMSMCSVGAILDLPPRLQRRHEWQSCLETTIRFVKRALPVYLAAREKGHPFRWWGVVHGYTDEEMKEWHAALSDVYPFTDEGEGWAVYPGPRARPMDVARTMHTFKDLGIKRAHFLACTGQPAIAAILAFGPECGLTFASFDSANIVHAATNRWIWRAETAPPFVQYTPVHEEKDETHIMKYLMACPCPPCEHMRRTMADNPEAKRDLESMVFGRWWELWFAVHSMLVQRQAIAASAELAKTDKDSLLKEALNKREYSATIKAYHGVHAERIVARGTGRSLLSYAND